MSSDRGWTITLASLVAATVIAIGLAVYLGLAAFVRWATGA